MKRYIIALFFLAAIVPASHAGQVGGLVTNVGEGGLSLSTGLSYAEKDVERNGRREEMTTRQLVVKGSYGLLPNLDLNVKLGFADLEVDDFEGRLDALYGVGFKFKMFQDPQNKVNVLLDGEVTQFSSEDSGVDADVLDYHIAFTVSNKAGNITPYGGIKFSETEIERGSRKDTADNNVGVFGGVDYFVNPNVFFNGEVSIFDQEALYVGVGYKF
ncbi:MAG TPA: hypothetical protein VJL62_04215 [Thermodesulfobacteriota bacterium]|nr:hypothetical protein [Thermodesulfobacteriota bacterium]